MTRRGLVAAGVAGAALAKAGSKKLAVLGGDPVRTKPFPEWPVYGDPERGALKRVLESGKWFRGSGQEVERFEQEYAQLLGAKYCVATANGTSALFTSLNALGVGPGDEVIVPPYTFVATVNVVLLQHALPVFVDSDIETFQMDASKLENAVTKQTAVIMPVHLGGAAADMDTILRVAGKRKIPVLEDACQSHLAEWKGKRVGTLGATGCFSFQASKNLNSGEGGAILTNDERLAAGCFSFHGNGRTRRGAEPLPAGHGANLRMTEFQGGLLVAQMQRLEDQARRRDKNGQLLTKMLSEIDGIRPAQVYKGCTRNAYHLYMFRYDKEAFSGMPRDRFLETLRAEGIPAAGGYTPLNKKPFLKNVLWSKGYRRVYSERELKDWEARNQCPVNERLCDEAVWFSQTMLLGNQADMEDIARAIKKVRDGAATLSRS
jgi:dTDP-4-amino-4,6-dideoxygalactose transaminase